MFVLTRIFSENRFTLFGMRYKPVIELQTRIELTRNHSVFEKLGYRKVAETAHPGFTRTTSITMRKTLTHGG